jgi:hypothetical protein
MTFSRVLKQSRIAWTRHPRPAAAGGIHELLDFLDARFRGHDIKEELFNNRLWLLELEQ